MESKFTICKARQKLAKPYDPDGPEDFGDAHPFMVDCPKCKAEAFTPCGWKMPQLDEATLQALLTLSEATLEASRAQFEKFDNSEDMHDMDEAKHNVAWFKRLLERT